MVKGRLTPKGVARYASLFIAVVVGCIALLVFYILPNGWHPLYVLPMVLLIFWISFFSISYGISRFVQSRVDQIHRTVHELKTRKVADELVMSEDVLGQVSEDVQEWADEKQAEIKELEAREKYRREFIGNLAHELKTPITSIQGYILTLLEGGLEDETVNRNFLERASKGVDRLTSIVYDMDTITRLEEGVLHLDMELVDLHELLDNVLGEMKLLAKKSKISIRNAVDPDTIVLCDASRITQVFANLINNAIKYGKEGGEVSVSNYQVDDRMMIEVTDDGIGIDEEHLPRLFERFYRVGASRSRHEGGSGLGLAIVKHIIEAHDQAITVVSELDKGTRFTFSLPKG